LVLAAVYSRHRPVSRGLVQFVVHIRSALHGICDDLHSYGLPGEVI
jgi:hypothetical protein